MSVVAEVADCAKGKIVVNFSYDRARVERMKMVSGRSWKKPCGANHWHVPLDMDACRALRRAFGDELVIGPQLRSWAQGAVQEERKLGSLAMGSTATLTRLPSTLPSLYEAVHSDPLVAT